LRLARKPKLRMRTNPLGRICSKKHRKNASEDRVSNFCSLGRYTHRVAISNHRLLSFSDGQITFRWRDSAHHRARRKKIVLPRLHI
jgi:hypothetical protein